MVTTSRCDGFAGGKRSAMPRASVRGASTRSIFAIAFSRLLTWVALVAFARNRSMNPCCRFSSRCWRSYAVWAALKRRSFSPR